MIHKMIHSNTFLDIRKLYSFLRMSKVNLWFLALSAFLSLCFTFASLYATLLLFPLIRGIIQNDFSAVRHLGGIHFILNHSSSREWSSSALFIFLLGWVYLVTIIKNVFGYLSSLSAQIQAKQATAKLRQTLLGKCMSYGKSFYDKNTISYLQSVLTKSIDLIEFQFKLFQEFITQALLLFANMIFMLWISWVLTLGTIIFFPVIAFLTRSMIRKIRSAATAQKHRTLGLNEKIFNMLYCMPVIKSFAKEQDEIKDFSRLSSEEIEHAYKMQRLVNLVDPIHDMGNTTAILLIALGLAAVMHIGHALDPAKAFVFFYIAAKIIPGLNAFNRLKLGVAKTSTALHDIEHVLNPGGAVQIVGGQEEFTGLHGRIEFRELSFRYGEEGPMALDKVSFSIERRSIVAIVGPSGSGKSTLVHLLLRFYDCSPGSIFINGKDIRDYDIPTLRKRMAFVSQEVLLFNSTIRSNITYGSSSVISDEFLKDVGKKVQAHDFIDKMPNKYDTSVGERGGRLAGGERQRLAIARAIIRDPEILIMDEATSALDSETEAKISDFLLSMAKEKTLIMIAHRLSTIKKADKVIHLEKGRVAESGTLQELIDNKGSFYKQWEAQKI